MLFKSCLNTIWTNPYWNQPLVFQSLTSCLLHSDQIPFMKLFSDSWFTDLSLMFWKGNANVRLSFLSRLFGGMGWMTCLFSPVSCLYFWANPCTRLWFVDIESSSGHLDLADMLVSFKFVVTTWQSNHWSISIPCHELYSIAMSSCVLQLFLQGAHRDFSPTIKQILNICSDAGKMLWNCYFHG